VATQSGGFGSFQPRRVFDPHLCIQLIAAGGKIDEMGGSIGWQILHPALSRLSRKKANGRRCKTVRYITLSISLLPFLLLR
jgi:hypothetical protein